MFFHSSGERNLKYFQLSGDGDKKSRFDTHSRNYLIFKSGGFCVQITWVMLGAKTMAMFLAFILFSSSSSTTSAISSTAQLRSAACVGVRSLTNSTHSSSVLH